MTLVRSSHHRGCIPGGKGGTCVTGRSKCRSDNHPRRPRRTMRPCTFRYIDERRCRCSHQLRRGLSILRIQTGFSSCSQTLGTFQLGSWSRKGNRQFSSSCRRYCMIDSRPKWGPSTFDTHRCTVHTYHCHHCHQRPCRTHQSTMPRTCLLRAAQRTRGTTTGHRQHLRSIRRPRGRCSSRRIDCGTLCMQSRQQGKYLRRTPGRRWSRPTATQIRWSCSQT